MPPFLPSSLLALLYMYISVIKLRASVTHLQLVPMHSDFRTNFHWSLLQKGP